MKTNNIENLWLPSIFEFNNPNLPLYVLKKQADFFNEMVKGVLHAKVTSKSIDVMNDKNSTEINSKLVHSLRIIAPKLDNYYFDIVRLFQIELSPYPIRIESPFLDENKKRNELIVKNEQELMEKLREIFSSNRAEEVIQNLMQQSTNNAI